MPDLNRQADTAPAVIPPDGAAPPGGLPPDTVVVARLRGGDQGMFAALIDSWSPGMLRAARAFVADPHTAEDVVQDAWLGVLRGIHAFEARSSLRTWVYRILTNTAKTRGVRDARTIPMSSFAPTDEDRGPTVDPARFGGPGDPHPHHWRSFPEPWPAASPEGAAVARETRERIAAAVAALPERQRVVITLRDIEGYGSDEICDILAITQANQRVLLHRARASVRAAVADYFGTVRSGGSP